jgi:hypothetical protein
MQAARAAEEVRLGALLARIDASCVRMQGLRRRMLEPPAAGLSDAAELTATELTFDARWRARLAAEIRAEQAHAAELAGQVVELRAKLSRALGRESAAAELVHRARLRARRDAARRADLAAATARPGTGDDEPPAQSESSLSALPPSAGGS